jgi:predicted AAA+ superfamily ATPase
MIIIHAMDALPRAVQPALAARLRVMPAVVVTGPRQAGKSTLASELLPPTRRYFTLDHLDVLDAASRDPDALLDGRGPVTLDEVQREPARL